VTDERLAECEQIARRYGSANCWTGSSSELTIAIIDLVKEVKLMREERDVIKEKMAGRSWYRIEVD